MWLNISTKAKRLFYHTKIEVVVFHKVKSYTHSDNHCRKHQKFAKFDTLHKLKIVRTCHLLFAKLSFSQVPQQLFYKVLNRSYAKSSKQQLTAHTSIVKGDMAKCYKHTSFSSNALSCSLVLKSQ